MKRNESIFMQNIPNFLSISRVILTFVVVYLIFTEAKIWTIVIIFSIAAFTDFLDGKIARKYKWTSEFGRKADMIADRFLWVGTALAFIAAFGLRGELERIHGIQLLLIMSREIITFPFAIVAFFSGNPLPQARYIAKVTTFLQGFALPLIILSISYEKLVYLSFPLSIATCVTGFMSALYYMRDIRKDERKVKRR